MDGDAKKEVQAVTEGPRMTSYFEVRVWKSYASLSFENDYWPRCGAFVSEDSQK